MTPQPDYARIAAVLVGGQPLDCKAYPDGSLVVIAPTGQKCRFSPEQVNKIWTSITRKENAKPSDDLENRAKSSPPASPKSQPAAKAAPKSASQRGRPRKAPAGKAETE